MVNPQTLEPVPQRAKNEITGLVKRGLENALRDMYAYGTNLPGFVAGPKPSSPPFQATQGTIRQACRRWARGSAFVRGPGFDGLWGAVCNPYLAPIGEAPTSPDYFPPGKGGQCVGRSYNWSAQALNNGAPSGSVRNGTNAGPITLKLVLTGSNNTGFWAVYSGTTRVFTLISGQVSTIGANLISVTPVDGLADNCTPGEPAYRPPQVVPGLPTLTPTPIDGPWGQPTPVDVTFDEDGNINVTFPDLGINFTVPNPLAGGGNPLAPGDQGDPGTIGAPTDEPAEEESDRNLTGVLVEVVGLPPRINASRNPTETYYKGLYYVFFGGDGGLSLNPLGAITPLTQFFYAPEGCNKFRVVPNLGTSIKVQPFYLPNED